MARQPQTQATIGQELGRKLSVKELGWDKPSIQALVLGDQNSKHFLGRFFGTVTGLRPYKIKEGERTGEIGYGLQGTFEGQSAKTGETVKGTVCYLPGYVNDGITAIFADPEVTAVKIAYDVYAFYDVDAATSYVFSVHDLLNVTNQSIEEVRSEIAALALPSAPIPLQIEDKS